MIETLVLLAFCAVDAVLIIGVIFFGWRPFAGVLGAVWRRKWRFLLAFGLVYFGLTIAIPWIDVAFYDAGYTLSDDFMIFFAPAFIVIMSCAAGLANVWELERKDARDPIC